MTDKIEHLMLEQFRRLNEKVDAILLEIRQLKQSDLSTRHHLRGLELTDDAQRDGLEGLKLRVDRIERRLELSDPGGFSDDTPPYEPRPTKRG